MLLAIDIGNTNITLGVWDGAKWRLQWRLRTIHDQTVDEYGIYLKMMLREFDLTDALDKVIFSSVVPQLSKTFHEVCRRYLNLGAVQVTHETDTGIVVATDTPSEVGADRIVNAAAAYQLYPGACIIIDMGTATTLDVVSANAELLGVIIAPGLELAANALTGRAAQLSRVALEKPPHVLGRNTVHAMQSGLIYGYASLIEGLVRRLCDELALGDVSPDDVSPGDVSIIATGGLINLITPHIDVIQYVEPWLTLTGLQLISKRVHG